MSPIHFCFVDFSMRLKPRRGLWLLDQSCDAQPLEALVSDVLHPAAPVLIYRSMVHAELWSM